MFVITVVQVCNVCGAERNVDIKPYSTQPLNWLLNDKERDSGWRGVDDKHMCPNCVKKIFT